jgi:RNA polymerase sigma-70 factor (ECF subfamily)
MSSAAKDSRGPGTKGQARVSSAIINEEWAPLGEEALATIYDREFQYVWHGLRRLGIPARDLPDVTHDVFFTVFLNLAKFDDSRPFRPWLFGFMFRVASDHVRLARNHRELLVHEPPDVADGRPEPDAALAEREQWAVVERALAGLDVPHRIVLVMHDFLGHKGHEVARELRVPVKTVFSRLHKARLRFVELAAASLADPRGAKEFPRAGTKR